ncbi:hypothetical protein [Rubrivirga marina]|uniref:Uncharacterized protein n=1 Tax=Rubrivirga marina TaxID=1196024 RepID=A0A271J3Q5_9BACT|nr:hypothetical protein [Rubrivirga marina]PAP78161.1 hypothetical protein BSZ37_17840 [Rubrivirga marina]
MDRNDILNNYVTDMAAVEGHILKAVERQLASDDTARYPDAVSVLTSLKSALSRHVSALEAYNERTEDGGVKEAVKEAVTGALGVAAGFYDQIRQTDKVSRMVRDTYTATSLAAVSYHMLYTSALALKADDLAELAITNLKDLTGLIGRLSEAVCTVVAAELANEDKSLDASVGQQAVRATQEAWAATADV